MNCPECGKNHRSERVADHCKSIIENAWGHYMILCHRMPGGVTEENLATYDIFNVEYFREIKSKRDSMKSFYKLKGWV